MYVYRGRKRIEVWAPAKLNLFLEVLHRRPDGFHEIETLMVPINLYDTLTSVSTYSDRIKLTTSSNSGRDDSVSLPSSPEANLVHQALTLLRDESGAARGIHVHLHKRIPTSAGMGGGSSDAAAALVLANHAWDLKYDRTRLAQLAMKLGSDVPFFLYGKSCVCRGRGEKISALDRFPRLDFVVVRPSEGLATAEVFRRSSPADKGDCQSIESIIRLISRSRRDLVSNSLFNRLQAAAMDLLPSIERISQRMSRLDVLGHRMSGSGSSYFAVCRSRSHAQQVAKTLRSQSLGAVFVASSASFPPMNSLTYRASQH